MKKTPSVAIAWCPYRAPEPRNPKSAFFVQKMPPKSQLKWDAAFLLAIGSFLLTVKLSYLQLTILASLLTIGAFCLQLELSCLQWESASNKGLKGLQAKKLNCKQKKLQL